MATPYVEYNGDGSTSLYVFSFGYIEADHVKVTVDGADVPFTWVGPSSVQLTAAPASGTLVRIYRETPRERLVDFTDGTSVRADDLDLASTQMLYISEEVEVDVSVALRRGADGAYDAGGLRVTNAGAPTEDTDLATRGWVNTAFDSTLVLAQAAQAAAEASADAAFAASVEGRNFPSRSAIVAYLGGLSASEAAAVPAGAVWASPECSFFKLPAGHSAYGQDYVQDLPGFYPYGRVHTPQHYGAAGDGTTDDTLAIRSLIAGAPSGGHIHFAAADSGVYLVDGLVTPGTTVSMSAFIVDKPLTVTGVKTGLIRIKGGAGASFFDAGTRGNVFLLDSSDIMFLGVHMDLNTDNLYGTEIDGTRYYAENAAGDASIGVTGVKLYRSDFTAHTTNVIVERCQFYRVSFAAVSLSGRKLETGAPDPIAYYNDNIFDTAGTISNCHVRYNYTEGGQRSTLVLTGGARHCTMNNNFCYNAHWAAVRLYLMCYACQMNDNYVMYDGATVDPTLVQTDELAIERPGNILPRLLRIGHGSRLAGTVRYCEARNNRLVVVNTDALDDSLTDATIPLGRVVLRMENGTEGNVIEGNVISGSAKIAAWIGQSTGTSFCFNHLYGADYDGQFQRGLVFGGDQTGGKFNGNTVNGFTRGITTDTTETLDNCQINENDMTGNSVDVRLEGAFNNSEFMRNKGTGAGTLLSLTGTGSGNDISYNNGVCTTDVIFASGIQDSRFKANRGSGYSGYGAHLHGNCTGSSVSDSFFRSASGTAGVNISDAASVGVRVFNNDLLGSGTDQFLDSGTDTESDIWASLADGQVVRLPGGLQVCTRQVEFDTALASTPVSFAYPKGFNGTVLFSSANVEEGVGGANVGAINSLHQTLTCETTTSAWKIRASSYTGGDIGTMTVKLFAIGVSNP
jgi:hypothetical protein